MMQKILERKFAIPALFAVICITIFAIFVTTSFRAGQGNLLMPLDDVYIHFQYARQMALGEPYVYNTGEPATSGATSLLYPIALAIGYLLGFQGLWLGLWAMLIGAVALFASMWVVYQICCELTIFKWLSVLTALSLALTGSIAWHFMSGMETGLVITTILWTLLFFVRKQLAGFVIIASILTLLRPEGGILAAGASILMCGRLWFDNSKQSRPYYQYLLLLLPIAALGIQPLVNYLLTGTAVATGNQAKSILAMIPHDWGVIITKILGNFVRMWRELIIGYAPQEGWYLPILLAPIALIGGGLLLFKPNYRLVGLLVIGWSLALSGAVSTLDTAFWHFKRYQIPLIVLFFPLAAFAVSELSTHFARFRFPFLVYQLIIVPLFGMALLVQFVNYHALNVSYVYQQPYSMALWLRDHTPEDKLVAVHDVGMMRYIGGRNTLDMVGLTTPEAAAYWRNGPGSVAEFLLKHTPDYIASYGYGHGYGLAFLADTDIYGEPLAEFHVEDWQRHANVALAADYQGIYEPFWVNLEQDYTVFNENEFPVNWERQLWVPILNIDVANVESEDLAGYSWTSAISNSFTTEVRQFNGQNCFGCFAVDGGRIINGSESFALDNLELDRQYLLVTGVHAAEATSFDIFINGEYADTRIVPSLAGQLIELWTFLPNELITPNMVVTIKPERTYIPYYHTLVSVSEAAQRFPENIVASFQEGNIALTAIDISLDELYVLAQLNWYAMPNVSGDYRRFVHIYDGRNQEPVAQFDSYIGQYYDELSSFVPVNLAPENWQIQRQITDDVFVAIENLSAGTYEIALGFYNPNNPTERLIPLSNVYEVSQDGRLWIGEITIEESLTDD